MSCLIFVGCEALCRAAGTIVFAFDGSGFVFRASLFLMDAFPFALEAFRFVFGGFLFVLDASKHEYSTVNYEKEPFREPRQASE